MLIDFVAEKQGKELSNAVSFTKKAGGAPANVAAAISRLGGKSFFVGCVGNDPFGHFLLKTVSDLGVSVDFAQQSDTFTTLAFVSLAEDGERDFVFSRGADRDLMHNQNLSSSFADAIVHFGAATGLLGGNLEATYTTYLQDASDKGAFISFDPNFRGDLWKNRTQDFVQKCMPFVEKAHFAKFSSEEAFLLAETDDLDAACRILHDKGAEIIAVTLGKDGTMLSTSAKRAIVPSIKVVPIDATGAGDAFAGCVLKQLSELEDLKKIAANFNLLHGIVSKANKAGAITTTKYGAIVALPTNEQLEAL